MTREECAAITRIMVGRSRARVDQTLNELACQNLDANSHALLDEVRSRIHEDLAMMAGVTLIESLPVRQADGG